tara:strand:- start:162 stop:695 length:534 start_codon:yes stop_codon:yes gene_type:complete
MNFQELIFPYDYILLIITFIIIIISLWKGFVQSLLGLLTWVGSIIITIYSYNSLSNFFSEQLNKIDLLKNYPSIINLIAIIISIPLIFLITLFILKRVKQFISNDLDKQILGIVLDKFFGFIYGFIFSYVVFSTILYGLENFSLLNSFYNWIIENSYILNNLNLINKSILIYLNLTI